ncbi:DEAD/DEAH box helicase family protein [Pedobacter psychroterrae]|uniref:DEAD/DEAH box helicase n=1 Tax=Pedobacter psychroterrae TaxID=2530453 RepID=A0A4R0NKE2_9SPHI|nr:DEAD/DEAH box helicase family protein [Pedobacter psychroterrae]TCD01230.1 DEAD/DEAH box helicase [Pedobacter psychroterrae]
MLRNTDFKPLYASGEDEPSDFFIDGLCNSKYLDLGLGYFRSTGFKSLAFGFASFIKNEGKMRFVINDSLIEKDKIAILNGQQQEEPDEEYEQRLINDLHHLMKTLSKRDEHFFNCLSWLIASDRLEIKVVVPKKNKVGIVHHKFGIFTDSNQDRAVFNGSVNFSEFALKRNVESISCEYSWEAQGMAKLRIDQIRNLFEKTWSGQSEVVRIISVEQVKVAIQNWFPKKTVKELIETERELLVKEVIKAPNSSQIEINRAEQLLANLTLNDLEDTDRQDTIPKLREYQQQAITNWKKNGYRGIFEMATGTGKTITALAATTELLKDKKRCYIIISCPFIHLAEQWMDEAQKFGLDSILVGESKLLWEDEVARQTQLFRRKKINVVMIVTTNASLTSKNFQEIISPVTSETFLIVDEVHYAGATSIREVLPENCPYRLGLSATPERYGDDDGTALLFKYFGEIVFQFSLKEAIGKFLCPYYYYPIPVEMATDEFAEYCRLSRQIAKYYASNKTKLKELAKMLSIERARLLNNSRSKIDWIRNNLQDKPIDFSLFYVGDQIFDDVKRILGTELNIKLHEFTSRQSRLKRKQLLEDFSKGELQSLIAMKCLDEGVDVPPTRVAYFLASSGNPREFVQRRGRILRKHDDKKFAIIYDLISIPPMEFIEKGKESDVYNAVCSAITKEYKRVQEFSSMAENRFDSINEMFTIADKLGLADIT